MHFELEEEAFELFSDELETGGSAKRTLGSARDAVNSKGKAWRKWLQQSLTKAGVAKLTVTGKLNGDSVQAIADFQKTIQVTPTGLIDAATVAGLEKAIGAKAPSWFAEDKGYQKEIQVPHGGEKSGDSRCTGDGFFVPQIDDVIATNGLMGIPFEYVGDWHPKVKNGLQFFAPQDRIPFAPQSFIGDVKKRLETFMGLLSSAGLQIEALLTAGSLVQRCMTGTNTPSNHSRAQAFDFVGVRWAGKPRGALRETIVHNYKNAGERKILMQLNAMLRLSFPNVLDYNYNSKHLDHLHCDLSGASSDKRENKTHLKWLRDALKTVVSGTVWLPSGPKAVSSARNRELYDLMRKYLVLPQAKDAELKKQLTSTYKIITAKIASGGV